MEGISYCSRLSNFPRASPSLPNHTIGDIEEVVLDIVDDVSLCAKMQSDASSSELSEETLSLLNEFRSRFGFEDQIVFYCHCSLWMVSIRLRAEHLQRGSDVPLCRYLVLLP